MAMPINNDLSNDTIEDRLYRLMRMQNNIDTHAAELGVAGPLHTWARNCHTRFSGAYTDAGVESGESKDATIMVHDKFDTTLKYYQQAKEILEATLAQYKPDDILLASYRIDKATPRTYLALTEAIDRFEATHNRLVAELDERVIAQAIIDQMVLYGNDFEAELESAGIEKRESDVAYQKQHSYYAEDTIKLKLIFKIACMVWGDDDPKLKDLGFVPSSEIWTPGGGGTSPEIGVPENLAAVIEGENVRISWDPVDGADSYQLVHTEFPPLFLGLYDGADTEFVHVNPDGGTHYYNVRAKKGDSYSEYPDAVSVEVIGVPPGPPQNLTVEVQSDGSVEFTWDPPLTGSPEHCNFYLEIVNTGDPEPSMPATPYQDELIVYQVTIADPGSGKTVYGWATAFDDGVEGEAAGPVSVEIT